MMRALTCVVALLAGPALSSAQPEQGAPLILQRMPTRTFKAAGLNKLTPSELKALDTWLAAYSLELLKLSGETPRGPQQSGGLQAKRGHTVEASVNDETFIINGEVFKAKTYCFDVVKGDQVIFTEGSALGACATAEFVVLRTGQKCDVWCE